MTESGAPAPSITDRIKQALHLGTEDDAQTRGPAGSTETTRPGFTDRSPVEASATSGSTGKLSRGSDDSTGNLVKGGVVGPVKQGGVDTGHTAEMRMGPIRNVSEGGSTKATIGGGSSNSSSFTSGSGTRGLTTGAPAGLSNTQGGLAGPTSSVSSREGAFTGPSSGLGGNQGGITSSAVPTSGLGGGQGSFTSTGPTSGLAGNQGGTPTSMLGNSGSTGYTNVESSSYTERGMSGLLSSDEHWLKAQAATEEARRQAKIVEQGARSHREAYEEYYKAERHETKTKHTVEEIETRIRGFNVDAKRAKAQAAREAYEQDRRTHDAMVAEAEKVHREASAMQTDVNAKGKELQALVSASKMHADRLSQLEAELAELRATESEARERYAAHVNNLEPMQAKHAHHKSERARVAQQLSELRAELDQLRAREGNAQRTLDMHQNEYDSLESELAEGDALLRERENTLNARKAELERTMGEHGQLTTLLTQHREAVGAMTKDTQAAMDLAQEKAALAERHAAELEKTRQTVAGQMSSLEASREALARAASQQRQLRESQQGAAQDVETFAQRASALQAELAAAKQRVDIAQAKKEELWEISKKEGALADKLSDVHYVEYVARPAGVDPEPMTSKSDLTADVAGRIKYGDHLAIDHQASTALSTAPSMQR